MIFLSNKYSTSECNHVAFHILLFDHIQTEMPYSLIPGGTFTMGSISYSESQPLHKVSIAPFLLAQYPVTQKVWLKFREEAPWRLREDEGKTRGNRIVEGDDYPVGAWVTWEEAREFCIQLGLRFPSEAEWEYACRGGTTTKYYWGEEMDLNHVWIRANTVIDCDSGHWDEGPKNMSLEKYERVLKFDSLYMDYPRYDRVDMFPHRVAQKKPNSFGLYDMIGNVYEFCEDSWFENYENAPDNGMARYGETDKKVVRGSCVVSLSNECESGFRVCVPALWDAAFPQGFRPARSILD